MISRVDVATWAAAGESETLEFKATTGERREGATCICGMLNHRGGHVLYGVTRDGKLQGQQVSDRTIEEIVAEIARIDPPVFPTVDRVPLHGDREVLIVTTQPGQGRPYSYKGCAFKRVGNTTVTMSRDEYNTMLLERLHGDRRWENEYAEEWTVDHLEVGEILKTIEEGIRRGRVDDPGTRDPVDVLTGLGLVKGGRLLRAGAVLFGKSSHLESSFPQCLLRVAKFRGTDRTDFLDNRQFHGNIFNLLFIAEKFLRESLPLAGRVLPGLFERVDDPLYPPVALREALANAFCHREYAIGGGSVGVAIYDDRLEITSSGALHFGLTAEALFSPHESLPWNPLIARVLFRRGIIESWGRGTLKMVELTEGAGLPRPDILITPGAVTVRFFPGGYMAPQRVARNLTDRQQAILQLLAGSSGGLALRQIRSGLSSGKQAEWQVKDDLALLRQLGLVKTEGHARGARWKLQADESI